MLSASLNKPFPSSLVTCCAVEFEISVCVGDPEETRPHLQPGNEGNRGQLLQLGQRDAGESNNEPWSAAPTWTKRRG